MRTNIDIDDELIHEAMQKTGSRTKRAVVEETLRLLVKIHEQTSIRRLRGKIQWEGDLDEIAPQSSTGLGHRRKRSKMIVVDSTVWIDYLTDIENAESKMARS